MFLNEQYFWFWLGQCRRYWELQFRLMDAMLGGVNDLAPAPRRIRPAPTYMRLVVDNTRH
jgi:hypothetical protein